MLRPARARRRLHLWSAAPAVAAAALLAAGIGGADRVNRAEKAVAARLSWCGLTEEAAGVESARWQGQSTVSGRVVDVVAVPVMGGGRLPDGLTVIARPEPGGGWRVEPGDAATAEVLGDCLGV